MVIEVQAWTVSEADSEEPCKTEMYDSCIFDFMTLRSEELAFAWAKQKMEEGFFVRMFRR